ncbi:MULTISPECIES: DUF2971 domain-containing protein [Rhizobium]|uniref:DUF2971 domain-containing protein n=1 Tax=Rhizobium TaxID=379 RepID=UPI0010300E35|nr:MULTISPECIES: DUF2971 domain-containing protein [Rhizobium]TAZ29795.1 DUF2971 domain-containing protein [Rhizobium leguminosarum]TBC57123.1 DUF2971 domain-containing protein [Rhizobium ruizarguesonis]
MAAEMPPKLLFKYRAFSPRLLDMLVADELFFSDPGDFNDPLDCRPSLDANLPNGELELVLSRLREQRVLAEMQAAAKSLRYRGPKTIDHIARHSQKDASRLLEDIRYHATDPSYEVDDPLHWLLRQYLEEELLRRYDRGIVSFGSRATCPLMWSHYGDQHNGVCAAYSVPAGAEADLHKIRYGGSRKVLASDVAMMENDADARRRVDNAVLLRKATSWGYEREWRLIGKRGVHDSPLELEEVIFGIRCTTTVKFTIVQALANRARPVRFFEMRELFGTFRLKKYVLDTDQLVASLPRRSRSINEMFEELDERDEIMKSPL